MGRVHLEASVISYLAAFPSRDLVVAGHQQVTRDWWEKRERFELLVSDAEVLCWRAGHRPPVICTPLELIEENEP